MYIFYSLQVGKGNNVKLSKASNCLIKKVIWQDLQFTGFW